MSNITTFEELDKEIKKTAGKPVVLEALWDGDTEGWFLCLYLYTEIGFILKKTFRHTLGQISLGSDLRVFSSGVLTEAILAKELGEKAVKKYGIEFYFPSEKEPDDNCPKWTERKSAIHCADCNKLIIPTKSPYLPKDVCYNCHLKREQNNRILQEEPYDSGVTLYLFKNDSYENQGYCSHFKDFPIALFVNEKVSARLTEQTINEITLDKQDIVELIEQMEKVLQEKLEHYKKPEITHPKSIFSRSVKMDYRGQGYELAIGSNPEHEHISRLINSIATSKKALAEDYVYKMYFKKGITYRDDSILRFIKYPCQGQTELDTVVAHYKNILTEPEVVQTLNKLQQCDCLTLDGKSISIKTRGKNIL